MICENAHPHIRAFIIAVFTVFLVVIFQAWFAVYLTFLKNFLGTEEPSDAQIFWSTVGISLLFYFLVKVGLGADFEPIMLSQGFGD